MLDDVPAPMTPRQDPLALSLAASSNTNPPPKAADTTKSVDHEDPWPGATHQTQESTQNWDEPPSKQPQGHQNVTSPTSPQVQQQSQGQVMQPRQLQQMMMMQPQQQQVQQMQPQQQVQQTADQHMLMMMQQQAQQTQQTQRQDMQQQAPSWDVPAGLQEAVMSDATVPEIPMF